MSDLYIGLMSGTSIDGIDAALVDFSQAYPSITATHYMAYSTDLRKKILSLCEKGDNEIERLGELDILLGNVFSEAANSLLANQAILPSHVKAIGSHGQTIRHCPYGPSRFTLQIADPNTIAVKTGITTITDFRRKDLAHGGQGAPLVPAFHQHVLSSKDLDRAIVNIGGIANVTLLPKQLQTPLLGFDIGPGNVLLDAWIQRHRQENHDMNGDWGAQGEIQATLLQRLLDDDFFKLPPPKSTGREHFNLSWLDGHLAALEQEIAAQDVQATLVELSAQSIVNSIQQYLSTGEILICGGGAHNTHLMSRLQALASPHFTVDSTIKYGLHPDWIEAMAFAWLARQTLNQQTGNVPSVTGAKEAAILGGIYYA